MNRRTLGVAVALTLLLSAAAVACNVPVFRFALERWQADSSELVVFFDTRLGADDEALIKDLEASSVAKGGSSNLAVIRQNVRGEMTPENQRLWESLQSSGSEKTSGRGERPALPLAVARAARGKDKVVNHWRGSLAQLREAGLLSSPVRDELVRRLQNGDAVVWLLIRSKDETLTAKARDMLKQQCEILPGELELPEGIGLPGSELYSEVPLLLQFSVLEVDPSDSKESYLVGQLTGFQSEAAAAGQPLIVPVFGRGRALEVIPGSELSEELVHDLTEFLCGACSCQVKEQNPGFDLLLTTNWNKALFGEDSELPPEPPKVGSGQKKTPELVPIPSGRKR
jgi:hypothetical protein